MATGTIEAELPGVNARFFVAGHTFARCAGKCLVNVALSTLCSVVCTFQDKNSIVIQVDHTVAPVVATCTLVTEQLCMLGYERGVSFSMAGDTINQFGLEPALTVAVRTGVWSAFSTTLVAVQTKARELFVVNVSETQRANHSIVPLVFDVTTLALVGTWEEAVQATALVVLLGYLDVTLLAAIGADAVHGCVAVLALVLKIGVRVETPQRFATWSSG